MIYLLTAIGLSPGGSTHLHTNNTQNDINNRITQTTTNVEEYGPCPVFASFTLAFALQPMKKHGKTPVRVNLCPLFTGLHNQGCTQQTACSVVMPTLQMISRLCPFDLSASRLSICKHAAGTKASSALNTSCILSKCDS